jgi:hypothetical protein
MGALSNRFQTFKVLEMIPFSWRCADDRRLGNEKSVVVGCR